MELHAVIGVTLATTQLARACWQCIARRRI